jgi:hypothetical protein
MNNYTLILLILKMTVLYNAVNLGWTVDTINENKIILSKKLVKMTELDHDTMRLIDEMVDYKG